MINQTVKPSYYRPPATFDPSPDSSLTSQGTTHSRPTRDKDEEEWILLDGTPASCAQIGLHHFFGHRGKIDLVVSGPNYGRNTTAVFALSSGTLGGALEAAVCRTRSIALSYAFFSRNHDPTIIEGASRHSVRVIEKLWEQWPTDGSVDLYSVNVPLVEGVEGHKTLWTHMLQNYWSNTSACFQEVEGSIAYEDDEEMRIREGEREGAETEPKEQRETEEAVKGYTHRHFKWAPRFQDVYKSVDDAAPGNDGWAVKEGFTSVTPLKSSFWHAASHLHGQELELDTVEKQATTPSETREISLPLRPKEHFYALIAYEDPYVQPLVMAALEKVVPEDSYTLLSPPSQDEQASSIQSEISLTKLLPSDNSRILQITPYEAIDWEYVASHPGTSLVNSYMLRKALIRKHYLSATVDQWVTKRPDSILKAHFKRGEAFELDYAEFLDDALVEAFELRASLERNEGVATTQGQDQQNGNDSSKSSDAATAEICGNVEAEEGDAYTMNGSPEGGEEQPTNTTITDGNPASQREWWILKPGMSDRGQGIRLFSTMQELQEIFDEWEADAPDSDQEEEGDENDGGQEAQKSRDDSADDGDYLATSDLRHFVAQSYIHPPLLLPGHDNRKFHIRTYVLCVGGLDVYVYREMLALFAGKPYVAPWDESSDLEVHLTNTCLQRSAKDGSVHRFWDIDLDTRQNDTSASSVSKDAIFDQICKITGEVFEAAAREMMMHFQPLPNAFEVFGVDFLVDAEGNVWLLEVNSFPDFKQTGDELRELVAELWDGVLRLTLRNLFATATDGKRLQQQQRDDYSHEKDEKMVHVRSVDLGRRWGTTYM